MGSIKVTVDTPELDTSLTIDDNGLTANAEGPWGSVGLTGNEENGLAVDFVQS